MSPRNQQFRLEDIYDALVVISEYIDDMDYDAWMHDKKTVDAVIRNLEIIGEAASHVSEDIQKQHTDIPWYQMKAMRNILIHEYFGIDIDVLWQTVKEDLPPLKAYLKKVLNS